MKIIYKKNFLRAYLNNAKHGLPQPSAVGCQTFGLGLTSAGTMEASRRSAALNERQGESRHVLSTRTMRSG